MKRELYVISGLAQIIRHGKKTKKHSTPALDLIFHDLRVLKWQLFSLLESCLNYKNSLSIENESDPFKYKENKF
jgi:hypothetical protein